MPSWEETEHYEVFSEEVEDLPEITSSGKKLNLKHNHFHVIKSLWLCTKQK